MYPSSSLQGVADAWINNPQSVTQQGKRAVVFTTSMELGGLVIAVICAIAAYACVQSNACNAMFGFIPTTAGIAAVSTSIYGSHQMYRKRDDISNYLKE